MDSTRKRRGQTARFSHRECRPPKWRYPQPFLPPLRPALLHLLASSRCGGVIRIKAPTISRISRCILGNPEGCPGVLQRSFSDEHHARRPCGSSSQATGPRRSWRFTTNPSGGSQWRTIAYEFQKCRPSELKEVFAPDKLAAEIWREAQLGFRVCRGRARASPY